MSDYNPVPVFEKHAAFLRTVVEMLFKTVIFGTDKKSQVILWKDPDEMKSILDLSITDTGLNHGALLKVIENTIKYSVKTGHPYFINQLFSGLDAYGLAAQWITDALNPSIYTYEVAPVFTLMEQTVLKKFCDLVNFPNGDGLFCPGGSLSNGLAINIARYYYYPDIKRLGMSATPKLCMFTSEESHYSVSKMASLLGIGESNVIEVSTDNYGRMISTALEDAINTQIINGFKPLMVVATLGTTVRGAFDPVEDISKICKKYNIWLHVDGAWGGGVIFSSIYKQKLNGIQEADSIVINPHKLLAVPQQCSLLLIKNGSILQNCHSKNAQYLFQKDKFYDTSFDCGDKYVQCGRRCDVFKFFLMWKAKGNSGFGKHVDDIMETAKYLTDKIKERKDFILVSEPEFVNVCFWYVPKKLRLIQNSSEYNNALHKLTPKIKELLIKEGNIMINYQPLKEYPNFFRFVSQNSAFNKYDADYLLDQIAEKGEKVQI